jgi:hypothetical protein
MDRKKHVVNAHQLTWPNRLGRLVGCMNRKQHVVLPLGGALLVAIFLFPYTTYLDVQEATVDPASLNLGMLPAGSTAKHLEFTTRQGFRPAWEPVAPSSLDGLHATPAGLGVHWSIVLAMVAAVVVVSGGALMLLRSRATGAGPSIPIASKVNR